MGAAPTLGAGEFTLEAWIKRTGVGAETTTSGGTGGGLQHAIPIVTKGRGEADGDNRDMNYFLGIDAASNKLAADFEEGTGGTGPVGQNHSFIGNTVITDDVWHHVAATYDGTWTLYLDGVEDGTLSVNEPPRANSIQHAAIGSALNSTGAAAGFFDGVIDEVRIWDVARTGSEILGSRDAELVSGPGLIARWGMNNGSTTNVPDSVGTVDGTATNGPTKVAGFVPPAAPNVAPVAVNDGYDVDQDTTLNASAVLGVLANDSDADGDPLTAVLDDDATHGVLDLNANGSFDYTPTTGYIGGDSFTYHVNDGTDDSNVATVSLTVEPAATNEAPVAVDDTSSTPQNVTLNEAAPGVLGNDTDADGDLLSAAVDAGPTHGALTLNADGSFDYVPTTGYTGPDTFTYHANDGALDSNIATVSLTITAAAAAPPTVSLDAPNDGAIGTTTSPSLSVDVGDPNGGTVDVEFWGRTAASGNFALLDSQASVPVGTTPSTTWAGRNDGQRYEWYAKVTDGTTTVTSPTWTFNTAAGPDPVFVGAGDIADCGRTQDEATGALIDGIQGNIWTAGDNVYPNGTANGIRELL